MIFLGADHAGFEAKELLKDFLHQMNIPFEDLGATAMVPGDDYPDYSQKVAVRVGKGFGKGMLICDTGIGMAIAANKIHGVRAALCTSIMMAKRAREHNDANILVIGSGINTEEEIRDMVRVFVETEFSDEARHLQRLRKIDVLESIQTV